MELIIQMIVSTAANFGCIFTGCGIHYSADPGPEYRSQAHWAIFDGKKFAQILLLSN
jgi:hypothetical protein